MKVPMVSIGLKALEVKLNKRALKNTIAQHLSYNYAWGS